MCHLLFKQVSSGDKIILFVSRDLRRLWWVSLVLKFTYYSVRQQWWYIGFQIGKPAPSKTTVYRAFQIINQIWISLIQCHLVSCHKDDRSCDIINFFLTALAHFRSQLYLCTFSFMFKIKIKKSLSYFCTIRLTYFLCPWKWQQLSPYLGAIRNFCLENRIYCFQCE